MPNAPDVTITLNGQSQTLTAPLTVHDLLQHLGMADRRVAVELNMEIVPRSRHGAVRLQNNDRIEVVAAIGGG